MTDSLNEFLRQQAQAGHNDSEGEFTLSLAHSLDKLSEFQLLNPDLFVLNLVSAAILSGSSSINFDYHKGDTIVTFGGRQYGREALEAIFTTSEPALAELRTAMISLHAQKPFRLRFESLATLDFSDREAAVEDGPGKGNRLHLQPHERTWSDKLSLRGDLLTVPGWLAPLQTSCKYAPIDIKVDGASLLKSRKVHISIPAIRLDSKSNPLPPLYTYGSSSDFIRARPAPGDFSAVLTTRYEGATRQLSSSVGFVYRGVCYARDSRTLDLGGLVGLVFCEKLKKNLSQTDLVEDETYQTILEALRLSVIEYVRDHLTQKTLLPELALAWFPTVKWTGRKLVEEGKSEEACRVEAWAYAHRHALGAVGFRAVDGLTTRYPSLSQFLRQYLDWAAQLEREPVSSVRRAEGPNILTILVQLSEAFGLSSSLAELLLPWIAENDEELLLDLFDRLLPLFPEVVTSGTIAPLILHLQSNGRVDQALHTHLWTLKRLSKAPAERSFCEASLYLIQRGIVDWKHWFERAFEKGLLSPSQTLRDLLAGLSAPDGLLRMIDHIKTSELNEELEQPKKIFQLFARGHTGSMNGFQEAAERTLSLSLKTPGEETARLMSVASGSITAGRPRAGAGPWAHHRYALALACEGKLQECHEQHERANYGLQNHWYSHLLVAEAAVVAEKKHSAASHAKTSLQLKPHNHAALEVLAEISPETDRRQAWTELAQLPRLPATLAALYYQEALLNIGEFGGLLGWIRLKIWANAAAQKIGRLPLPRDQRWLANNDAYSEIAIRQPEVARYLQREQRANWFGPRAAVLWARYRLLEQLQADGPLEWKPEYRD